MALTKDDLEAVRGVIREETRGLVIKDDLAKLATKEDLADTARRLKVVLASKEDLQDAGDRLGRKMELESESIARVVAKESARLRKRDEEVAGRVGYTFPPEIDEQE